MVRRSSSSTCFSYSFTSLFVSSSADDVIIPKTAIAPGSCSLSQGRFQNGPCPMQLVVPSAVRNAVSAATITFTASSMILCFFIISSFLFCHTDSTDFTDFFRPPDFLRSHRNSQKSQKFYVLRTFFCHTDSTDFTDFTSFGLSFCHTEIHRNHRNFTSFGLLLSTEIKEIIALLSVRSLCRRHFP